MRFIDIFNSEQCKDLYQSVNQFSSDCLKQYNDEIESLGFNFKSKDIFDYVWGTVELSAVEICLIDSPLVQRLRNIKQLGFAHYVYCNADYSRFAHTIGVIEIAGRMSKMITRNLKQAIPNKDKFNMEEVVRLAALFHDSGHMFYSHVSERFFTNNKNYDGIEQTTGALTYFNEQISTRASLHEMLSVMLVNSNEVHRFFSLTAKHLNNSKILKSEEVDILIDYISGLIVGTAVDKSILPYSMIIKGAIDADRMDYLSRDSSTTKVPLAVDIGRLINKITVVKINNYQPSNVWNDHSEEDYPYQSMAIQYSAQRLIWQLFMARSILYQSIYFHHKKLTAESMLRQACENIFQLIPEKSHDFSYIMSLDDCALSEHFVDIIIPDSLQNDTKCKNAQDIIKRIKNRNLYKRVASFSQDILDSVPNYIYESFVTNVIENPFSTTYSEFLRELTDEYYVVLQNLGKAKPEHQPIFMFIEANWKNEMSDDIPIDFGNAPYKMSSQVFKETPTFGEENRQKQYYLVTDQIERDLVYIALEKILFSKYNIKINEGSSTCAKFTSEQIAKTKSELFELNYYKDSLVLLPDRIVRNLYNRRTFSNIVSKYQSFSGVRGSKVTEQSLFDYLKQFLLVPCTKDEIKHLLNGVLSLLAQATFIDRDYFSEKGSALLKQVLQKGYENNLMVKLGGAFDSANRLTYYFNDIAEKSEFRFVETVPDALKLSSDSPEKSCIVFFDDGAYSGKQVVSIFQELMGVPIEERETDEIHTKELDPSSKELIKSSKIILAYICFNKMSEKIILKKLSDLGIENVEIVFEQDLSNKIFSDTSTVFSTMEERDIVHTMLKDIGYQVQKSSKLQEDGTYTSRWTEERIQDASLGYNDAQQTVIFEFNVPTYTLTPFWQNGYYNKNAWKGLFQRTEK